MLENDNHGLILTVKRNTNNEPKELTMPRQAIQTSDYDFTVTQTPLYTVRDEDNKKSGYLANVRQDTGEVLGSKGLTD